MSGFVPGVERLIAALSGMGEGVVILDRQARILFLNPSLVASLGLRALEEDKSYYSWEIFRDAGVNVLIETCLREKRSDVREHSVLLSGKTFEIRASPTLEEERFEGLILVFHDVTRLKELERARTEFVANVSHELKTPLTAILGYVETLEDGAAEDPDTRRRFLGVIGSQAASLKSLVENLLFLSSVEHSTSPLAKEKVDLTNLLEEVAAGLRGMASEKSVTIHEVEGDAGVCVPADRTLLGRVFSNLLENAVKYNVAGGAVFVRVQSEHGRISVSVRDRGIGFPEEERARIFERFYRVDKSRSREAGGAGLGLSIAKHIMEKYGGRIEAQSKPGQGSVFTCFFDRASEK